MAAGAWLVLLILGSLQPARPGIVRGNHRLMHYVAFAGAALLLFCLSGTRRREVQGALAIAFLGFCLELLQHLIYRMPMEWRDVSDDSFAVLVAFALYSRTGARKPMPSPLPQ